MRGLSPLALKERERGRERDSERAAERDKDKDRDRDRESERSRERGGGVRPAFTRYVHSTRRPRLTAQSDSGGSALWTMTSIVSNSKLPTCAEQARMSYE